MTVLFDPERETETFTISFAGSRLLTSRLLSGRATDPSDPYEFVADGTFVAAHDAHVGDRFPVVTWSRDQTVNGEAYVDDPKGPSFEAELVGVLDTPDGCGRSSTVSQTAASSARNPRRSSTGTYAMPSTHKQRGSG